MARARRPGPRTRFTSPRTGWIAVTGTPGTGKTVLARHLRSILPTIEVSKLSIQLGAGRRSGPRIVHVDLRVMRRTFRSYQRAHPTGVVVGHLAHFLPVSGVVVLRCHPRELERRLRKSRRIPMDRQANVLSEVLDLVLIEALGAHVPVWEVDTTHRSPAAVARTVSDLITRRPRAIYGRINWLADRRVTEELLRGGF